jgi:hypothetical protein
MSWQPPSDTGKELPGVRHPPVAELFPSPRFTAGRPGAAAFFDLLLQPLHPRRSGEERGSREHLSRIASAAPRLMRA